MWGRVGVGDGPTEGVVDLVRVDVAVGVGVEVGVGVVVTAATAARRALATGLIGRSIPPPMEGSSETSRVPTARLESYRPSWGSSSTTMYPLSGSSRAPFSRNVSNEIRNGSP